MKNAPRFIAFFTLGLLSSLNADDVATLSKHKAWKLLENEECGQASEDRIIGGVNAGLGQYPWLARLGYRNAGKNTRGRPVLYECGGALLNKRYVISAAHCLQTDLYSVRLGEYDVRTAVDCVGDTCAEEVQDIKISEKFPHEQYNPYQFANDLMLLRLEQDAEYNSNVAPICLYKNPKFQLKPGDTVEAAGWGYVSMKTLATADVLQTIKLPVVEHSSCVNTYKNTIPITMDEICAGGKMNKDACAGDSGGPLMKVDDVDGSPRTYLAGVVSFGPTDCGTGIPGVYTNVPRYTKWILDHIH